MKLRALDVPHVTGAVSHVGELIDFRRVDLLEGPVTRRSVDVTAAAITNVKQTM